MQICVCSVLFFDVCGCCAVQMLVRKGDAPVVVAVEVLVDIDTFHVFSVLSHIYRMTGCVSVDA